MGCDFEPGRACGARPRGRLLAIMLAGHCLAAAWTSTTGAQEVPRVANPATPRDGSVDIQLEETWRAGGPDDDVIFGMITQVRQDGDGNLYVMDAQLSRVHVYSPTGEHRRTLFGEGEGPGEIRGPRDFVLLDDGRVGAVQEMPGKLVFVDRGGDPAGALEIGGAGAGHGGFCQTFAAFTDGELLLVAGFLQAPGDGPGRLTQTSFLSRCDDTGRRVVDFAATVNEIALADFVFDETRHLAPFWWNAAVGPGGRVWVAPDPDRYEIRIYAADGGLERIVTREYAPWRRTAAEKDEFVAMVQAIYHGAPIEVRVKPREHEPTILYLQRGLRVRPDGSLLVLTARGVREPANGAMATFDVFAPDGTFTRQIHVHGPWDGRRDGIFLLGDDRAVVVTGFADAMVTQFTGGNMAVDVAGDAGSMEVIGCRVRRD
jgi:hypothetical protein